MDFIVYIALFGWPAVVFILFTVMPPRRAVMVGMLGAWLFLPIASIKLVPGIPDVTKMFVTCVGVFMGAMIFDPGSFTRLRWSVADLAMVVWLLVPVVSSITAGFGVYDGLSASSNQVISWGLPYAIGRLYFGDVRALRELALGVFIAGLVYTPLVLFEARMSPQLHTWVYGYHQHSFAQSRRADGWRPTVFMQHGLAVAMFMGTAAVCGMWLWFAGKLRVLAKVPVWTLATGLFVVAGMCRSTYALMLMLSGIAVLFACRVFCTRAMLVVLLLIAPAYISMRTVGGWNAVELRDISSVMAEDRQGSLKVRLDSEDAMWKWLQGNQLFGRTRLEGLLTADSNLYGAFVPDGLWLISVGKYGVVGLSAMLGVLLLPPLLFLARHPPRVLMTSDLAGAMSLLTVLALYAMDNLMNAMVNPIYLLAAGGLGVAIAPAISRPVGFPEESRPASTRQAALFSSPVPEPAAQEQA